MSLRRGGVERAVAIEVGPPALPDVLVKFAGVDDREAAQVLAGWELWVDRSRAAPLAAGEYYAADLCRLRRLRRGRAGGGGDRGLRDRPRPAAGGQDRRREDRHGAVHGPLRRRGGRGRAAGRAAGRRDRAVTFTVLTLFPGLFAGFLGESILARAIERGLVAVRLVDIRDYAADRHRVCDDAPYGGGPGMVMKPEPLAAALEAVGTAGRRVVYLTPSGRRYDQRLAAELAAGTGPGAGVRPLRGRRPAGDRRLRDRRGVGGRLRAVRGRGRRDGGRSTRWRGS